VEQGGVSGPKPRNMTGESPTPPRRGQKGKNPDKPQLKQTHNKGKKQKVQSDEEEPLFGMLT